MKRIIGGIALILGAFYVISFFKKETNFLDEKKEIDQQHIKVYKNNEYLDLDFEEYLIGVVAGEMPVSFEKEALKAQAVAARTYAYNYLDTEIKATKDNQVYLNSEELKNKWKEKFDENYSKIKEAVEDTKGEIMTYQDKPIKAFFYSESNGYTEKCENVFKEKLDYYDVVESNWEQTNPVTITMSKDEFCQKLDITCDNFTIDNINYDESKRVSSININNKTFKGTEIRKLLNLRSTDFLIEINDIVSITTKGYGHGVGMSQRGANAMALLGYKYDEILKYYYKNIEISDI